MFPIGIRTSIAHRLHREKAPIMLRASTAGCQAGKASAQRFKVCRQREGSQVLLQGETGPSFEAVYCYFFVFASPTFCTNTTRVAQPPTSVCALKAGLPLGAHYKIHQSHKSIYIYCPIRLLGPPLHTGDQASTNYQFSQYEARCMRGCAQYAPRVTARIVA